jgi:hypothetical protein
MKRAIIFMRLMLAEVHGEAEAISPVAAALWATLVAE